MSQGSLCHRKYNYNNLDGKGFFQAIDAHDVIVKKCRFKIFFSYFGVAVFLTITFYLIMMKDLCVSSIWKTLVCFLMAKVLHYNPVKNGEVSNFFLLFFLISGDYASIWCST
ncbi:GPI-GlcNAc transferase complex, PIG-H component [Musa troglodytarum]|uniref:GPI-GlcNAc transferase complex, PIG-H component n=1 Tax=Musa troglodytarum TaxID=320322 RepID=A0A9E7I2B7_9LILI|nr:GPI-GlcNAc transferase complex, PIG-H component [Musa troglodytarum]